MKKNIIITYGTFDLFHYGHLKILEKAKKLGNYLIVGLSTEKFNKIKGKKTFLSYAQRKKALQSIKFVDKIIPEKNWNQKVKDIQKYNIKILVMGSDWKNKFNHLPCKVKYFLRTPLISTTILKKVVNLQK